jgi:hypothetical protein
MRAYFDNPAQSESPNIVGAHLTRSSRASPGIVKETHPWTEESGWISPDGMRPSRPKNYTP